MDKEQERQEAFRDGQHRQQYVRNGVVRKFVGYGNRRAAPFDKILIRVCLDDLEEKDLFIDTRGQAWVNLLVSERIDQTINHTHNVEVIRLGVKSEKMEGLHSLKQLAMGDTGVLRNGVDSNKIPYGEKATKYNGFVEKFKKKKPPK